MYVHVHVHTCTQSITIIYMFILYISAVTECPSGVPMVQCFADPCSVTQCPQYPDATCNADYCGGCNARFYDNNIEITDQCTGKLISL